MARPGLQQHRKFKRLVQALRRARCESAEAVAWGALEWLWLGPYEAGDPYLGSPDDVEMAARWEGEPGVLFKALLEAGGEGEAGFIEPSPDRAGYQVHDLLENAPDYVQRRMEREQARRAKGRTLSELRAEAGRKGQEARRAAANAGQLPATDGQLPANGDVCPANVPTPAPAPARDHLSLGGGGSVAGAGGEGRKRPRPVMAAKRTTTTRRAGGSVQDDAEALELLAYFNEACCAVVPGSPPFAATERNLANIRERLAEGVTIEQLRHVSAVACARAVAEGGKALEFLNPKHTFTAKSVSIKARMPLDGSAGHRAANGAAGHRPRRPLSAAHEF